MHGGNALFLIHQAIRSDKENKSSRQICVFLEVFKHSLVVVIRVCKDSIQAPCNTRKELGRGLGDLCARGEEIAVVQ